MKIIKQPPKKPTTTKKVTCPECGAMLEYTKEDIHTKFFPGGVDRDYTKRTIACPVEWCNESIRVEVWK